MPPEMQKRVIDCTFKSFGEPYLRPRQRRCCIAIFRAKQSHIIVALDKTQNGDAAFNRSTMTEKCERGITGFADTIRFHPIHVAFEVLSMSRWHSHRVQCLASPIPSQETGQRPAQLQISLSLHCARVWKKGSDPFGTLKQRTTDKLGRGSDPFFQTRAQCRLEPTPFVDECFGVFTGDEAADVFQQCGEMPFGNVR